MASAAQESEVQLQLASSSPRRAELLTQIGVPFRLSVAGIEERQREGESPDDFVLRLAQEKAEAGLKAGRPMVTLGADTIVVCDDEVFGKPQDEADAARMLRRLSGRNHMVFSAVCVGDGRDWHCRLSRSELSFRIVSDEEISRYWQSGEPEGKAGAYAIQGLAAVFVTQLQGSYTGVVGLPLAETAELLGLFDIPCWQKVGSSE